MDRRTFLLGLFSSAAVVATDSTEALAQAVECYDPNGYLVPCPPPGYPLPYGIVRRAVRRSRRRRVRRAIRHHHRPGRPGRPNRPNRPHRPRPKRRR